MSRVFLSHSSADSREAAALKAWLIETDPGLADEIFLDLDPNTGIPAGVRWKEALRRANDRCEAVICLLSDNWDKSHECKVEYRNAEDLNKPIFVVRLEPLTSKDITSEWQRCDLFGVGPKTPISVNGHPEPVEFLTEGLLRLRDGLRAAGIGADSFAWPPAEEPYRAPYRGWQPLEEMDAAVYFGRDVQIGRALNVIRELRSAEGGHLFVVLGPSGVGKSSFLRAGLLPRLRRDDRHFLPMGIVRPQRHPLTGDSGLAQSIHQLRTGLGLTRPGLGEIKRGSGDIDMLRGWLAEAQQVAQARTLDRVDSVPPTLVLPIDQAEELFSVDAGEQADGLLDVLSGLLDPEDPLPMIAIATIRADRYEPLQTAPQLANVRMRPFDDLKPMPQAQFKEVICGPARRAGEAGNRLMIEPELVDRLLEDWSRGADTLPLLSLTLARLYEDYRDDGITLAEYESMGGLRHVVQGEVDKLLSTDSDARQRQLDVLRSAFVPWLATVNPDNDQPMRRVARWSDLPPASHALLEQFLAKRLLVRDERDGEVVVEVALESLLRQWDALAEWLRIEAVDLKDSDTLERAALAWRQNGCSDEWLIPGSRLADAEALAAKPGFRERLNPTSEFLLASRQSEDARIAEERRRQEADLQAARDREEAAKALATAETQAKEDAERHASALKRRNWFLRAAVALMAVTALVAVLLNVRATRAEERAEARSRDAAVNSLIANSQAILSGSLGHSDDVLGIQLALAADNIASGSEFVLLSALSQEQNLLKIINLNIFPWELDVSPDGALAVTNGGANLQLWNTQTWDTVGDYMTGHTADVQSVAFSPDGKLIVSGGADNTIRLWDVQSREPRGQPIHGHEGVVADVAFSRDGSRIVSGGSDKTIRVWDTAQRAPIGEPMRGHTAEVSSVAFSPDGRYVVSGGFDKTVRLWDLNTRQPVGTPRPVHEPLVASIAFSPDGRRYASAGGTTFQLWEGTTGEPLGPPVTAHSADITRLTYSPDGTLLATAGEDNTVRVWNAVDGSPVGEPLAGHESGVTDIAFDADAGRIISTSADETLRVWDIRSAQVLRGHDDVVMGLDFSQDGRRIVSSGLDQTIRQWDVDKGISTGTVLRPNSIPSGASSFVAKIQGFVGAAFSPDGKQIIGVGSDTVRTWDAASGMLVSQQASPPPGTLGVLRSEDGKRFATLTGTAPQSGTLSSLKSTDVQVRDADMRPVGSPLHHDQPINTLTFSRDGQRIVTASEDFKMRLWDAESGRLIGAPFDHEQAILTATFSPDGHTIAAGALDSIQLWNVDTGETRTLFQDSWVLGVAFNPDGSVMATGGADGRVRLWDTQAGIQIGPALAGHTQRVGTVEFSPDGTKIASASADKTIRVWPVPTPSREKLCDKIPYNISRNDWDFWVSPDIPYQELCPGLPIAGEG